MPSRRLITQLSCTIFFFTSTTAAADIWHVSIFEGPAPPPGKGAPIQASALRNTQYLPAQIASIVAAYVLSVVIIGAALLFVGRRLRRKTLSSPASLSMEMMKPKKSNVPAAFDPSPISYGCSPASAVDQKNMWPSPVKGTRSSDGWGSIRKGHRKQPSESQASVVTFDENVIEDDRAKNEREMERLYAAVMEDDERRSASKVNLTGQQQPQHPPEFQHLRNEPNYPPPPSLPDSRSPPRSLAATRSPRTASRPTPISVHSRNSSRSSLGSFGKRHGIRHLAISPPMGSPGLAPDYDDGYGESEPLSPRTYADPGPPPPTPDEQRAARFRQEQLRQEGSRQEQMDASRLSPRDARFPMTSLRKNGPVPPSPTVQTIHEVTSRPELISRNTATSEHSVSSKTSKASKKKPPQLALRTQAAAGASAQSNPLRSAPLPLRIPHPTNLNVDRPEPSPRIKATVLERKAPNHGPSLRTPGTGVPMTPYSPYMPFTPLTPMTPSRLVTRQERKRREKEEGKRVPTIEDAVEEEADMW
ncbi:MAG: hypothetical protein OHK93_003147 [Ramalina farinacea]|uniref:Uncharacterized protein n=1 Tax=Ramalina farinacea TaxID=258253 RepID=A0AA43QVB5_9LECA|nr:hypothetical protein [Ramalina farinacea]